MEIGSSTSRNVPPLIILDGRMDGGRHKKKDDKSSISSALWDDLNKKQHQNTDITFILKDSKTIAAHKLVLRMCGGSILQKVLNLEKQCKEIRLPEITSDAMYEYLRYIYIAKLYFKNIYRAAHIYRLAVLFDLRSLIRKCSDYIETCHIKTEELFELLELAHFFNVEILKNKCLTVISTRIPFVLDSSKFLIQDLNFIATICIMQQLGVKSEFALVMKVFSWAFTKYPEKFQKIIKPLLPHIRFLSMSRSELTRIWRKFKNFISRENLDYLQQAISLAHTVEEIKLKPWCNKRRKHRKAPRDNKLPEMYIGQWPKVTFAFPLTDKLSCVSTTSRTQYMKPKRDKCALQIFCPKRVFFYGLKLKWKKDPIYIGPTTIACNVSIIYGDHQFALTYTVSIAEVSLKQDYVETEVQFIIPFWLSKEEFTLEVYLTNIRGVIFQKLSTNDSFCRVSSQRLPFDLISVTPSSEGSFFISKLLYGCKPKEEKEEEEEEEDDEEDEVEEEQ